MNLPIQINLVQYSKLPAKLKLDKKAFDDAIQQIGKPVQVWQRETPALFLKTPLFIYQRPDPTYVGINISNINTDTIKKFAEKQLDSAIKLTLEAKVYYPRIIFFKAADPSSEEDKVRALAEISYKFDKFLEAKIAALATNEKEMIDKFLKLLTQSSFSLGNI